MVKASLRRLGSFFMEKSFEMEGAYSNKSNQAGLNITAGNSRYYLWWTSVIIHGVLVLSVDTVYRWDLSYQYSNSICNHISFVDLLNGSSTARNHTCSEFLNRIFHAFIIIKNKKRNFNSTCMHASCQKLVFPINWTKKLVFELLLSNAAYNLLEQVWFIYMQVLFGLFFSFLLFKIKVDCRNRYFYRSMARQAADQT